MNFLFVFSFIFEIRRTLISFLLMLLLIHHWYKLVIETIIQFPHSTLIHLMCQIVQSWVCMCELFTLLTSHIQKYASKKPIMAVAVNFAMHGVKGRKIWTHSIFNFHWNSIYRHFFKWNLHRVTKCIHSLSLLLTIRYTFFIEPVHRRLLK